MRFDILSYALGIICFILATLIIPFFGVALLPTAYLIVLLLFGLFFMASGYSARPRAYVHKITAPTKPPKIEETEEKPPQPPSAPSKSSTELTKIKGVGPKRAAQLKALQITSVEDLAQYSAKNLANKLKISSKITAKWVKQAKNLLKETSV